jgi:hypothetical protein
MCAGLTRSCLPAVVTAGLWRGPLLFGGHALEPLHGVSDAQLASESRCQRAPLGVKFGPFETRVLAVHVQLEGNGSRADQEVSSLPRGPVPLIRASRDRETTGLAVSHARSEKRAI